MQAHRAYRWARQGWGTRRWTLSDARQALATLEQGAWGRPATLRTAGGAWTLQRQGAWTLQRQGAWSPRLVVRDAGGAEVARLAGLARRSAAFTGPAGPLWWRSVSWWRVRHELHDAHGRVLARMRPVGREVEADADPTLPGLEVVLAAGLLNVLAIQQAATMAAVVAAT